MRTAKSYFIYPGHAVVAYPKRDSSPYKERYNIPEAETIIRGIPRYQGFPEFIKALGRYWALDDSERDILKQSVSSLLFSARPNSPQMRRSKEFWVDSGGSVSSLTRRSSLEATLLTLCAALEKKMQFEENERDFVILQHKFEIGHKDGSRETRTSTLCECAEPKGYSAMARLVGLPCAVAVQQVLNGTLSEKGALAPMNSKINDPLMKGLKEKYGIYLVEKTIS